MTKTLLIILTIFLIACSNKGKGDVAENQTEYVTTLVNQDLINPFHTNRYCDSVIAVVELVCVEKIIAVENSDTLSIELIHIPVWDDPGDYLKLRIADMAGNIILEDNNFDGWVKHRFPESILSESLIKSDYAAIVENKTGMQLLLFGYTYASQPGLLTIIDLFPTPRIVFNQNFEIVSISVTDDGYKNYVGTTNFTDSRIINMKEMKLR